MAIINIGIELAKSVFAVHGVNKTGKAELVKPKVPRDQLLGLIAKLPLCLIGMEACSGADHWARLFRQCGHTVRLITSKFVIPYCLSGKRGKNDTADAVAICEAITRSHMRFVPIKRMSASKRFFVYITLCKGSVSNAKTISFSNFIRGLASVSGQIDWAIALHFIFSVRLFLNVLFAFYEI